MVTRGIELDGNLKPLRLAHVYASLETMTPRAEEEARGGKGKGQGPGGSPALPGREGNLSALEALLDPAQRRVVLVGEPGSGKSTFLQYVTLFLADKLSVTDPAKSQFAGVEHTVDARLRSHTALPLRIALREFAPGLDAARPGSSEDVLRHLETQLCAANREAEAELLRDVLGRGLALVLFDGLDEVPGPLVPAVRQAIQSFATGGFGQCRVVVTCRIASYEKREFKLEQFPDPHRIAALSSALRAQFVHDWYRELAAARKEYQGEDAACAESLLRALDTERLQEMSGNPFFLTAMAALHRPEKPLPDTGAKLMDQLVRGILDESRKRRADTTATPDQPELATLLEKIPEGVERLREQLQTIAYLAREKRQKKEGRAVDGDLLKSKLLLTDTVTKKWVNDLIESLRHRAGLLQSQDGTSFEFAYRFEEFLAGCHLANDAFWKDQDPETTFEDRARKLFAAQGDYARLVIVWAAGIKVYVHPDRADVRDLVDALVPATALTEAAGLAEVELASEIARDVGMVDWGEKYARGAPVIIERLRTRLEEVRDGEFPVATRARAAAAIGRFGDLRKGVGVKAGGVPDLDWLPIPAGPFIMGSEASEGFDWERPQMAQCRLIAQPYAISRYPVTVAQYAKFLDAEGYDERQKRFWTGPGWEWRCENNITGPENYGAIFLTPNHPRVGVSWYEAFAFCRWLTERLRAAKEISAEQEVRLPTEAQWERAARHTDGRSYPWRDGGKSDDKALAKTLTERCNWGETGLGNTSAVGLFPKGHAECGAEDMAGNVWEWCGTPWLSDYTDYEAKVGALEADPEKITRGVLRGGSWGGDDPRLLRCSSRFSGASDIRSDYVGFRCVVVGVGGVR
ncbi:hypothetical protein LBMAG56_41080 [Verrucomicrobiota bacterium]|nr:hypothetical protein LBMAG56_41080 [Verrucomicrobiota bacterium]